MSQLLAQYVMSQLLVFRGDQVDRVLIHGSAGAGTRGVYTGVGCLWSNLLLQLLLNLPLCGVYTGAGYA